MSSEESLPVKSLGSELQLVTCTLSGETYGVDVLSVREIIRVPKITRTPEQPLHVEGVIDIRGKVITVISLRTRLGLRTDDDTDERQSRVIVLDVEGQQAGFKVDSVAEVIRIKENELQPTPTEVEKEYIKGIYNDGNNIIALLDLRQIFCSDKLLTA